MRLTVTGDDIPGILRRATRTAFKFEQLDSYLVDEDEEVFERWLRGEASADEGMEPWLALMREITASGRAVRRARVVTVPPTDYIRFEAAAVPASAAAGEDIRYISRIDARDLPDHDFWLIDDDLVMTLRFDHTGAPLAHELTDDPADLARHREWADRAWRRAIPYADFASLLQ